MATAKRFAEEGSKAVVIDWNQEALSAVLSENKKFLGGIRADVSSVEEVESAFVQIDELMDGLDVLISNAGISVRKLFWK